MVGFGFLIGSLGYYIVRDTYNDHKKNRNNTTETISICCLAVFIFSIGLGLVLLGLQIIGINLIDVNFVSSNSTNQTVNTISYLFK